MSNFERRKKSMVTSLIGISILGLMIYLGYKGYASSGLIMILPIVVFYMTYQIRKSQLNNKMPDDLKFIAKIRSDKEAYFWGYTIVFLMFMFWLFLIFYQYMRP
jgi:hypothetical protein